MPQIFTRKCCWNSTRTGTIMIGAFEIMFSTLYIGILYDNRAGDVPMFKEEPLLDSFLVGLHTGHIIASLFLIHGASTDKRYFLLPWIVFTVIIISVMIVSSFLITIDTPNFRSLDSITVAILVKIYFFMVVLSHYNIQKETEQVAQIPAAA